MNLQIGQKVYVKKIGNATRYLDQKKAPIEEYVEEATVSKVGRVWFEVDGRYKSTRFALNTGRSDTRGFSSDYLAYESMQEIYDEIETINLLREIRATLDARTHKSISLPKLRAIKAIIEGEEG
jgi:hypothetical protein